MDHRTSGGEDTGDTIALKRGGNSKKLPSDPEMKVARAITGMEGGDGEFSYTRNSRTQSQSINLLKPILEQEIQELKFIDNTDCSSAFRVADFGCSVGANTLQYAEICYRAAQLARDDQPAGKKSSRPVAVQYFFSDLPSNDFNTLFRQLEDWRNSSPKEEFYAVAVPGSFYGRLFPRGSLHVAIAVMALHWMSKVPDVVVDKASPAYNKGRLWIGKNPNSAVVEAFEQTARQDLRKFLLCRAEEVALGGLVVFYCLGRHVGEQHPKAQRAKEGEYASPFGILFEATWKELVVEGIIEEERTDSFNVPFYPHNVADVRAVAESTNAFHIKRLEIKRQSFFEPNELEQLLADPEAYGRFMRTYSQSLLNSFVLEHIGEEKTHEFFKRLERNAATSAREKRIHSMPMDCLWGVLIRK